MSEKFISTPISPEKMGEIKDLDERTLELQHLRLKLKNFLADNRALIAKKPKIEGEEKPGRYTLQEMATEVMDGAKIDDLIDWDKAYEGLEDEPKRRIKEIAIRQRLRAAFVNACANYGAMEGLTGGAEVSAEQLGLKSHYAFRLKEWASAEMRLAEGAAEIKDMEEALDELLQDGSQDEDFCLAVKSQRAETDGLKAEREEFLNSHPEAYYIVRFQELRQMKDAYDSQGKIVETPYVTDKIEKITEMIAAGSPVFVHGELGAGKTELAKHVVRTKLCKPHVKRWLRENPEPSDSKEREAWLADRERQREPLLVSGFRGIEGDVFLGGREIQPGQAPTPEAQTTIVAEAWKKHRAKIADLIEADENPKKFEAETYRIFRDAYQESFRTPLQTKYVLGPMLQAMREGRPLIIDEMNAIPHHVLIMLNDYLTLHPGDRVNPPFPGMEGFVVKEGFCVIATGNYKPEDGLLYPGRQQLDAALLSRFGTIHYDYLPQSLDIEAAGLPAEEQRQQRRNNELFAMLATRLLDNNMVLTLPEKAKDKLVDLARVARGIQDIFSGVDLGSAWEATVNGSQVNPNKVLKENVLSIRHLLRILDAWTQEGFKLPLDVYLFEQYVIRSSARPEEMSYLYNKLQVMGDFFPTGEGWPAAGGNVQELLRLDLKKIKKDSKSAKVTSLSAAQTIELLFGPAPERSFVLAEEAPSVEVGEQVDEMDELERIRALDEAAVTWGAMDREIRDECSL
ncbi:MAG: hypothetical protein WC892_05665 [Patescibacteria group bacterium]